MKIRTGFVTNSSSSSFIIAGIMTQQKYDYEYLEELNVDSTYDDYYRIVGKRIATAYDYETKEISLDNLDQIIGEAKANVEKLGLDPNDVKIYFGVEQG